MPKVSLIFEHGGCGFPGGSPALEATLPVSLAKCPLLLCLADFVTMFISELMTFVYHGLPITFLFVFLGDTEYVKYRNAHFTLNILKRYGFICSGSTNRVQ